MKSIFPISYNNFSFSNIAINIRGINALYGSGIQGVGIKNNIKVENCYWNADDNYGVEKRIIDAIDFPDYKYFILYEPYKLNNIENAGIQ